MMTEEEGDVGNTHKETMDIKSKGKFIRTKEKKGN
jgi:hypothetical protein